MGWEPAGHCLTLTESLVATAGLALSEGQGRQKVRLMGLEQGERPLARVVVKRSPLSAQCSVLSWVLPCILRVRLPPEPGPLGQA